MPVICSINWSEFKQKIEEKFPKVVSRKVLEIIDECEFNEPEEE